MTHPFPTPKNRDGLPAEPGEAFDLLGDLMMNMLTRARHDPACRDALVARAKMLTSDIDEEVRAIEKSDPTWFGWAMLSVPGSEFPK